MPMTQNVTGIVMATGGIMFAIKIDYKDTCIAAVAKMRQWYRVFIEQTMGTRFRVPGLKSTFKG